jgi:hypothetical protein
VNTTATTTPCWAGPCPECGGQAVFTWQQFRSGHWHVRASCSQCDRFLGFAPKVSPFVDEADANASPTATLDAVILAEAEGVKLVSDGKGVWCEPWGKASERLLQLVRERSHLLAGLLGVTQPS